MSENNYEYLKCRPTLNFYHPNGKGTGCAAQFALTPASEGYGSGIPGYIELSLAEQRTVGDNRAEPKVYPTFAWDNKIEVKLDFTDVCKMLQVLRGECESIDEYRGLYIEDTVNVTTVKLSHEVDTVVGYRLIVIQRLRCKGEDNEKIAHIFFNYTEALGLSETLAGSLRLMAFGV